LDPAHIDAYAGGIQQLQKKLGQAGWGRMRRAQPLLSILIVSGVLNVTPKVAVADDLITLVAAVSQTGKYALNGANTKNGYDLAARKVNEKGGIEIGGKHYRGGPGS
jgi:ABC-type branched-subunit amino acid transport system substrate-binding protein